MENIEIPADEDFLTNLILQRTGPFLKLGGAPALNEWFSNGDKKGLLSFLLEEKLINDYLKILLDDVKSEISELRKLIPSGALDRIVSIGPGNGLIELILISEGFTSELLLIDIEQTAQHHHGFNAKGSGYASLTSTKNFILKNLEKNLQIHTCNPTKDALPEFEFTLLISLLSMGFHYPCDDYYEFISSQSSNNSFIVFDKRRGTVDEGFEKLNKKFSILNYIQSTKSDRVILK
jgi:hypothetical protein